MRTRPRAHLAVALIAGVLTIGAMGLPASAGTGPATIVGGQLDLYDSGFNLVSSLNLGPGANPVCTAASGTATVTATGATTGTLTVSVQTDEIWEVFPSTFYRVQLSLNLTSGSYSGNITLTGSASPPNLPSGPTTITLDGGNTVGDDVVTGTCGALLALSNGYLEFDGLAIDI